MTETLFNMKDLINKQFSRYKNAEISIYAKNYATGKYFSYGENKRFGIASIIKVAIALTLFQKAEDGLVDLDKLIKLKQNINLEQYGNGIFPHLSKDTKVSLRLACVLMLKLSDNMATNLILEYLTQDEINVYMKYLGFLNTQLTLEKIDPIKLEKEGNLLGVTTAKEMAEIFQKVALGDFPFSKSNIVSLQKMLETDYPGKTFDRKLPILWNVGSERTNIKTIYAKEGSFPLYNLRCDAYSILTNKNEVISCAVFTKGIRNKSGAYPSNLNADHPANILLADLAKEVFDYLY